MELQSQQGRVAENLATDALLKLVNQFEALSYCGDPRLCAGYGVQLRVLAVKDTVSVVLLTLSVDPATEKLALQVS